MIELTLVLVTLAFRRASADAVSATWVTAILLLSTPYWLELYMGQFTMVAVGLTCLAVLGWTMRPHSAGGHLSGAVLVGGSAEGVSARDAARPSEENALVWGCPS